jgi:hypothetical protein
MKRPGAPFHFSTADSAVNDIARAGYPLHERDHILCFSGIIRQESGKALASGLPIE